MLPNWLHVLSIGMLLLGVACALWILVDVLRHPQQMKVMNVVWPVSALFGLPAVLWLYYRYGRLATAARTRRAERQDEEPPSKRLTPFPAVVAKGTLHCGSGCTLGDIAAEWLAFLVPVVATWFGWRSLFDEKIFAVWGLDFLFAFFIGIVFQYFAIVPMRGLSFGKGLVAAVKADALSLASWQVGMYGFMAFAHFVVFKGLFDARVEVDRPEFWFAMQLAMLAGFATAYPVNWWLIRAGWKEKM